MKRLKKRIIAALVGVGVLLGSVGATFGIDISEFSFVVNSAWLDGDILTVEVNVNAPNPYETGNVYCYFKSGETEMGDPLDAKTMGVDIIADGSVFALNNCVILVRKDVHEGEDARYTLQFDVSGKGLTAGDSLEMIGAGTRLGMDEGFCIVWDSERLAKPGILASCTITDGSGSISSSTELEVGEDKDITDTTGGEATVTGVVENETATLNVTSVDDKSCVVAYTTDNGATYTRVNAEAGENNSHNFIIPDYTDNMQFVVAVKGDLNGDGETGGTDASQIERFEAGLRNLTPLQVLACDINGDGEVSGTDAAQIERVEAGFRTLAWDN